VVLALTIAAQAGGRLFVVTRQSVSRSQTEHIYDNSYRCAAKQNSIVVAYTGFSASSVIEFCIAKGRFGDTLAGLVQIIISSSH